MTLAEPLKRELFCQTTCMDHCEELGLSTAMLKGDHIGSAKMRHHTFASLLVDEHHVCVSHEQ